MEQRTIDFQVLDYERWQRTQMNGTNNFSLFLDSTNLLAQNLLWPAWTKHPGKSIIQSERLVAFLFFFSIMTVLKKRFRETCQFNILIELNSPLYIVFSFGCISLDW